MSPVTHPYGTLQPTGVVTVGVGFSMIQSKARMGQEEETRGSRPKTGAVGTQVKADPTQLVTEPNLDGRQKFSCYDLENVTTALKS